MMLTTVVGWRMFLDQISVRAKGGGLGLRDSSGFQLVYQVEPDGQINAVP